MTATAFITHPDCLLHDMGQIHPECPERLHAIEDQLVVDRLMDLLRYYSAPQASRAQLERVHDADYVEKILAFQHSQEARAMLDPDTAITQHTPAAALRAAGALVLAVDLVMQGKHPNAFCSVRPPGHHALRGAAMGFCFFNNIAVGAAHALAEHGLQRVAICDFDVHHGNGTEEIFAQDGRVMLCSTFQYPFYPETPLITDDPRLIHAPLAAGAGGEQFRAAVSEHWLPALERFRPELIMISAGFDAHQDDDMSHLRLRSRDYAWVTQRLMEIAAKHARRRVVSTLEGGYVLPALGRSVSAHVRVLMGLG